MILKKSECLVIASSKVVCVKAYVSVIGTMTFHQAFELGQKI